MAEKGKSGTRWQAKLLLGIPALAAICIFMTSVVVQSLRSFRSSQFYSVEYRKDGSWEKIRTTVVREFCGIELESPFPWIWLQTCPNASTEVIPLSQEDETEWVSRIPESKAMVLGKIFEVTDKSMNYYDEKARKFVIIGFPDGKGGLKRKWFKLLIDGTIAEVH